MCKLALYISLFTVLVPVSVGLASDGLLEINQACAVNTGCFSGDEAGLPVTIDGTAGYSYRLTSDLTVPDENTHGILVREHDISVDLNGFSIRGPVTCSGIPLTCSHTSGTGSGVATSNSLIFSTSVKNGSIAGMGQRGVLLGPLSKVTNLRLRWNRADGIYTYSGSSVSGNSAYQNGHNGIVTSMGSTISGNTVYRNGADGIVAHTGSMVSGNLANSNGGRGIWAESGSSVSDNTVIYNGSYGLYFWGSPSAYSGNVISNNTIGAVTGTAIQLGQNACDGNTTCP